MKKAKQRARTHKQRLEHGKIMHAAAYKMGFRRQFERQPRVMKEINPLSVSVAAAAIFMGKRI